jgi:hypothetical protein
MHVSIPGLQNKHDTHSTVLTSAAVQKALLHVRNKPHHNLKPSNNPERLQQQQKLLQLPSSHTSLCHTHTCATAAGSQQSRLQQQRRLNPPDNQL